MKKLFFLASLALGCMVLAPITGIAQDGKEPKTLTSNETNVAGKKRGAAKDANVVTEKPSANDRKKVLADTANKNANRGDVYGSNYCDVVVDNWTGYYVDIYVDGNYRSTVSPYAKKTTWAVPGKTRLYGKANFTDGSYSYWGPVNVDCYYKYTWSLYY